MVSLTAKGADPRSSRVLKSVGGLVRPIAALIPDWLPAEGLLSLVLVLAFCFLVGVVIRSIHDLRAVGAHDARRSRVCHEP
jgi:hypothetical protein